MAVTFAVGAVTGTVLSFEFGLLWPKFMGRFGAAFGVPFAFEGLFFFTEAIFVAIYIYGWRRLKPWAHFWTGVPIVIAGIGGTRSVVAANAWMNEPAGFTLNSAGKVVDVDPWSVIFNKAFPYEAAHMLVAAYVVGGFLIASVYAMGMLRGRRDRYHRLGFHHPLHRRRHHDSDPDGRRRLARSLRIQQRARQVRGDRVGAKDDKRRARDAVRPPELERHGERRNTDPGSRVVAVRSGDGHEHDVQSQGPRLGSAERREPDRRPTIAEANAVHLAWDVMVGLGTLLFLLSVWYGL